MKQLFINLKYKMENKRVFKNAICRKPSRSMTDGITTADLGKPDYDLALV